jgi:hypothetical protein
METDNSRKNQQQNIDNNQKESPDLTIAEKTAETYFKTDGNLRIFEPSFMADAVRTIVGKNEPLPNVRGIHKPSDELADLLIQLGDKGAPNEIGQRSIQELVELCFLHSAAYQSALKIYWLEHTGRIVGGNTAAEVIQEALEGSHHWTQDFGNAVAELYEGELSKATYDALIETLFEVTDGYVGKDDRHARFIVPIALRQAFESDAQPSIKVTLHTGRRQYAIGTIPADEAIDEFGALISEIDNLCQQAEDEEPEESETSGKFIRLEVDLVGQEKEKVNVFYRQFPTSKIREIAEHMEDAWPQEQASDYKALQGILAADSLEETPPKTPDSEE